MRSPTLLSVLLVALVACSGSDARTVAPVTTSSSTTTSSTTTSTTAPSTTTTAKPAPPPGLIRGSRGPEVLALEQRLGALKYDPGRPDGVFDASTQHAVIAFQKVQGLARTGRATPDVLDLLARAGPAEAMLAAGGGTRVEIDLRRQVLLLFKDGALERVLPVSTGNGKRYCVDGECARAVTPGGSFRVTRKILGLRVSRLGQLYNPLYFNGGIAIHGSPSVPAYPASHGCVRIPMFVSAWFHNTVSKGTPVYVVGGPKAPVPFNEQAPPENGSTTSTTASTTTTSSSTTTTTSTSTSSTLPTSTSSSTTTTTAPTP